MSFTHGEMGAWAGVVEYESHVFGLALVVVSVVNGRGDTKPSIRSILDEWRPWVCVTCGVVDDILVRTRYYDRGCR